MISKSSLFRSKRNSTPISRVSVRLESLPLAPGIWASSSDGAASGLAGALRARPLTFLRFIVRALNWSPIVAEVVLPWQAQRGG